MRRFLAEFTVLITILVSITTASNFVCPDDNNYVVTDDSGVQYVLGCTYGKFSARPRFATTTQVSTDSLSQTQVSGLMLRTPLA